MARKGPSEEQRVSIAIQASRRLVAQGENPLFRIRLEETPLGLWMSDEAFGIGQWTASRSAALDDGRAAIARILDCDPAKFAVELERRS